MNQTISIPMMVRLRDDGRSMIADVERGGIAADILPSYQDAMRLGRTPHEGFTFGPAPSAVTPPPPRPIFPRSLPSERSFVPESTRYEASLMITRERPQARVQRSGCGSLALSSAASIAAVAVCGTHALLANLLGSKMMGLAYDGYAFAGGATMLNYLAAGMAFSPAYLGIMLFVVVFGESSKPGAPVPDRRGCMCLIAGWVGVGAAVGASAAHLAQARDQLAQDVMHSAGATGVGTAVILGIITVLGCC